MPTVQPTEYVAGVAVQVPGGAQYEDGYPQILMPTLQAVTPGAVGEYLHVPLHGSANVPVQNCVDVQVEALPQGALFPTLQVVSGGVVVEVVQPPPQLDVCSVIRP